MTVYPCAIPQAGEPSETCVCCNTETRPEDMRNFIATGPKNDRVCAWCLDDHLRASDDTTGADDA